MYNHDSNYGEVKESAVAKSKGEQDEKNMLMQDAALFRVLSSGKKISREEAEYREDQSEDIDPDKPVCRKCKFNLGDEKKCHVVEGEINNEYGISKFFSAKGEGMLPGDIVWNFIKKDRKKIEV